MKLLDVLFASAILALLSAPATASEAIIKKARCIACHAVDKKLVGPAYKDVAAKYRGDAEALTRLVQKVRSGGTGVWGEIPMPPNPEDRISDADLNAAVEWILNLQ